MHTVRGSSNIVEDANLGCSESVLWSVHISYIWPRLPRAAATLLSFVENSRLQIFPIFLALGVANQKSSKYGDRFVEISSFGSTIHVFTVVDYPQAGGLWECP